MRSMTEEQAINYIKAGYYPNDTEIEAICDLQDVFGHLPYKFNLNLLANDELKVNAEKLFRLIWNKDDVDHYVELANKYTENLNKLDSLYVQLSAIQKEINEISSDINKFFYQINI